MWSSWRRGLMAPGTLWRSPFWFLVVPRLRMLKNSWENIGWVAFYIKLRYGTVMECENCSLWLERSFRLRNWKWSFAQMDGSEETKQNRSILWVKWARRPVSPLFITVYLCSQLLILAPYLLIQYSLNCRNRQGVIIFGKQSVENYT